MAMMGCVGLMSFMQRWALPKVALEAKWQRETAYEKGPTRRRKQVCDVIEREKYGETYFVLKLLLEMVSMSSSRNILITYKGELGG
jgi:hypothetical protein